MTTWKDSLQRRDEVKAAFAEGWKRRGEWMDKPPPVDGSRAPVEVAWADSDARKRLEKPLAD